MSCASQDWCPTTCESQGQRHLARSSAQESEVRLAPALAPAGGPSACLAASCTHTFLQLRPGDETAGWSSRAHSGVEGQETTGSSHSPGGLLWSPGPKKAGGDRSPHGSNLRLASNTQNNSSVPHARKCSSQAGGEVRHHTQTLEAATAVPGALAVHPRPSGLNVALTASGSRRAHTHTPITPVHQHWQAGITAILWEQECA